MCPWTHISVLYELAGRLSNFRVTWPGDLFKMQASGWDLRFAISSQLSVMADAGTARHQRWDTSCLQEQRASPAVSKYLPGELCQSTCCLTWNVRGSVFVTTVLVLEMVCILLMKGPCGNGGVAWGHKAGSFCEAQIFLLSADLVPARFASLAEALPGAAALSCPPSWPQQFPSGEGWWDRGESEARRCGHRFYTSCRCR